LLSTLLKELHPELFETATESPMPVFASPSAELLSSSTAPRLRVLVAEDNPVNQNVMARLLMTLNADFDIAKNGLEAVEMFKKVAYDVILMDMIMPEMGGVEASSTIRAIEHERGMVRPVPIIAATANATSQDRLLCSQAGMTDFLAKPIRLEALSHILGRYRRL